MKINFKKFADCRKMTCAIGRFWKKYYHWVFIASLLVALGGETYVWHKMIYSFQWTENQKNEYKQATMREVNLKEEQFKKALEAVDQRKKSFGEVQAKQKDIFKKY